MLIRVGLDQWIMVNGQHRDGPGQPVQQVGLNTAGLSGCVAIGMGWGEMMSLAHVYSDCTAATWTPADGSAGYLQALDQAFAGSHALVPQAKPQAVLYWSEGTPRWLPRQLYNWLDARDIEVYEEEAPSCRIWIDEGRLKWSKDLAAHPSDVNNYTTSDNAATTIQFYKALSANAVAASPPQGE
ncbi:hypothetical protein [Lysobacter sp. Root690]|uniref:hypothetical protein n=1 Tax=Lysobacter sp. Root690 TaxID=1736588 RepID=UPI0006FF52BD|nr:hypothetical protein [Lysobacter sp. Root690]KRB10894.1 hypothetical protein ASD86_00055 [Lysobacter sp. Root690]